MTTVCFLIMTFALGFGFGAIYTYAVVSYFEHKRRSNDGERKA